MSAETAEQTSTVESSLDVLYRWYHVPAIVLVVGFMFWVRMQNYDRLRALDGLSRWDDSRPVRDDLRFHPRDGGDGDRPR